MTKSLSSRPLALAVALGAASLLPSFANAAIATPTGDIGFTELWRFSHVGDGDGEAGSEINTYDAVSNRVFVTNAAQNRIDIINATTGTSAGQINLSGGPNSVAAYNGVIAVAVENGISKQNNGTVDFYDATNGTLINSVTVGALPDNLTFTPDGTKVLVANEGEPNDDYTVDPVGSVSIIDLSAGINNASVTTAGFGSFNADQTTLQANGVRIFGPGASVAQDLEPEYIAVNDAGTKAFVALQENNAIAVLDINSGEFTEIRSMGTKDYVLPGNEFDASNDDGIEGNQQNWPVKGLYQPDAIVAFEKNGETYYVTANEGDARDYDGYSEETRIGDEAIDPALDALLSGELGDDWQADENLGRLKTTTTSDTDGDGDLDELLAFGGRDITIFDEDGNLVTSTGDLFEDITLLTGSFAENRSDDKGPEPESLALVEIAGELLLAVGLERTSDVLLFTIEDDLTLTFENIINAGLDISPEGLKFYKNGNGETILLVSNEVSSTTTAYAISQVPIPGALVLFASALAGLGAARSRK